MTDTPRVLTREEVEALTSGVQMFTYIGERQALELIASHEALRAQLHAAEARERGTWERMAQHCNRAKFPGKHGIRCADVGQIAALDKYCQFDTCPLRAKEER